MEKRSLNVVNAAALVAILAVAFFFWFYAREQFMWAIIFIAAILLFVSYINASKKLPWQGAGLEDVLLAVAVFLILGFAWFYMREQFCWGAGLVILIVLLVEIFKLRQWLKDTVSIQVIIKRKDERDNK